MKCPSVTTVLSGVFIAYVLHSMWSLSQLFVSPTCTKRPCIGSYLNARPALDLLVYGSAERRATAAAKLVLRRDRFQYEEEWTEDVVLPLEKVSANGSLYLHAVVVPTGAVPSGVTLVEVVRVPETAWLRVPLTRCI